MQTELLPPEPATAIAFTIVGEAQPAGSKRAFVIPGTNRASVSDANPKSKGWKQLVAAEVSRVFRREPLEGPLRLTLRFYRLRPKGHYRSGKNAHLVREGADCRPISKPDVLKLARAVEDALTKIVYRDDSQIVEEVLEKHWGAPARVEIEITSIPIASLTTTNGNR